MRTVSCASLAVLALCVSVLADWSICPAAARAQAGHIAGSVRLDAHLNVGFGGGLGPGMRLEVPLARRGLISSANDELALTLGADVIFHTRGHYYDGFHHRRLPHHGHHEDHQHHDDDGDLSLIAPIAVQWNFILRHNWTVFPELGLALVHHYDHLHVLLNIAAGARWHFGGGQAALLLRVTRPAGFQVGIAW